MTDILKPALRGAVLTVLLTAAAFGADFAGTWKGEVQTSSGKAENTLVLTVKGGALTGTITNQMGKFEIQNGTVEGDDVFFNVVVKDEGDDFKMTYRGHAFGGEIQFKVEAGERIIEMIAKKAGAK